MFNLFQPLKCWDQKCVPKYLKKKISLKIEQDTGTGLHQKTFPNNKKKSEVQPLTRSYLQLIHAGKGNSSFLQWSDTPQGKAIPRSNPPTQNTPRALCDLLIFNFFLVSFDFWLWWGGGGSRDRDRQRVTGRERQTEKDREHKVGWVGRWVGSSRRWKRMLSEYIV